MGTSKVILNHENLTILPGCVVMAGAYSDGVEIVRAFRLHICGAVLAVVGAVSYIRAVREIHVPLAMRQQAEK